MISIFLGVLFRSLYREEGVLLVLGVFWGSVFIWGFFLVGGVSVVRVGFIGCGRF